MSVAVIAAVNRPAFPKVVGRSAPFQRNLDGPHEIGAVHGEREAIPPAGVLVGASDVSAAPGSPALMVNDTAFEVPPPGAGVTTVTGTLPCICGDWRSPESPAVTRPALTNVVVRSAPFQWTLELPTKLLPFTVSVKPFPPAGVLVGASEVSAGTGFAPR